MLIYFFKKNLCRTTFSEFAMKHGRDSRFKAIEKMKDREVIFIEFMTALRKRDKEDSKTRGEKVCFTESWALLFCLCRTLKPFNIFKGLESFCSLEFQRFHQESEYYKG